MPWTMSDYPSSWKNLEKLERKKAIDIGNAMLKDGYKTSDIIPIATAQAEKWYQKASQTERDQLNQKNITQHEKNQSANPSLNQRDVHVYFEDNVWKVKTESAQQASDTFDTKKDAIARAKEIANHKQTRVQTHTKE
ncbi:DUF2188 domain-containing protein [Staphylococcus agnetis]|uniref:DUF2188 domain-containing protein n=1 Tax=Staphylococcus agnetis TaxID=985762 RepID=UPI0021D1F316|nr:DUF2188 domain-containing protein [Staphylococcus agnetis]UXU60696.1 DUF2188 domain-containing protein [Staphylococcus agnetis]UXU63025.1 DUF2188 domain-containing protein [Staphylococcus agnetis]